MRTSHILALSSNLTCLFKTPFALPSLISRAYCSRDPASYDTMSENTALNKQFWTEKSKTYDDRFEKTIEQIIAAVREKRGFIGADWIEPAGADADATGAPGRTVRLLDYACGPGTMSRALYPYVTQCQGIDLAPGMVAEYKSRAKQQGLSPEQMDAVEGNLLDDTAEGVAALASPALHGFDVAAVGFGAHHFDDPTAVVRGLVERLRPGGVLFIADLLPHEPLQGHSHSHGHGHGHGHGHHEHRRHQGHHDAQADPDEADYEAAKRTISKHGFTEDEVRSMFEAAGAGQDFAFEVVESIEMPDAERVKRVVFFARGTKPSSGSVL